MQAQHAQQPHDYPCNWKISPYMIKRLRIGKDFGLTWTIKAKNAGENSPYNPSSDSVLLLVTPYNKVKAEDVTFDGIFVHSDRKSFAVTKFNTMREGDGFKNVVIRNVRGANPVETEGVRYE